MTYALSPAMRNLDGMRIVLTWGERPADLDSHITYPGNHIFFRSKKGTDANLDVDDTTSFGPETITLERKHEVETTRPRSSYRCSARPMGSAKPTAMHSLAMPTCG
jgi:hypothetical protein